MKLGLISDIHWMNEPPSSSRAWHGAGEFTAVGARLQLAFKQFHDARVDLTVLSGDLAHHGDVESLTSLLAVCRDAPTPVLVVAGNHDVTQRSDALEQACTRVGDPNIALARLEGSVIRGIRVAGVQVAHTQDWFRSRIGAFPDSTRWGADPVVLISHYPALSLSGIVSQNGLPYPGDILDRARLHGILAGRSAPTVVIGGHVHARATAVDGPLLQLTVGSMIEPPFECALIGADRDTTGLTVRRQNLRLHGPSGPQDPVFSPAAEAWRFADGKWIEEEDGRQDDQSPSPTTHPEAGLWQTA